MKKKAILSFFAAASLALSMMSVSIARDLQTPPSNDGTEDTVSVDLRDGGGEATTFIVGDGLNNGPVNPDIDTFLVRCKGKTTICADVKPFGVGNDNTVHVSVICISPAKRRGFGELKYGIDGELSDNACVVDCVEALVSFQCEYHDDCDGNYNTVIRCVGKDFNPKYPQRKQ